MPLVLRPQRVRRVCDSVDLYTSQRPASKISTSSMSLVRLVAVKELIFGLLALRQTQWESPISYSGMME